MTERLDTVTLEVAGMELTRWLSYTVDSDLLIPADAWTLSVDVPTADAESR